VADIPEHILLMDRIQSEYPKVTKESYRRTPQLLDSDLPFPEPAHAVGKLSYMGPEYCMLAQGSTAERQQHQTLVQIGKYVEKPPCYMQCPKIAECLFHPGHLRWLEQNGYSPAVVVRAHNAREPEPTPVAVNDEPPEALVIYTATVRRKNGEYFVSPLDQFEKVVKGLSIPGLLAKIRELKVTLIDIYEEAAARGHDLFRQKETPLLALSDEEVQETLAALLSKEERQQRIEAVRGAYGPRLDQNLDLLLTEELARIQFLFSGEQSIQSFRKSGPDAGLTIRVAKNNWPEIMARGMLMNFAFDGTASIHWQYVALPPEFSLDLHRLTRPPRPNTSLFFDGKLTKGIGKSKASICSSVRLRARRSERMRLPRAVKARFTSGAGLPV
jgi:hypothetical protein